MTFTKMQGTGNDFIVLDALRRPVKISPAQARRLCDRHTGVGADQILILEPSRKADFRMRILNADGSEVEMCGNGIRCAARYVYERGRTRKKEISFETKAGLIRPALENGRVRVDMGAPVLDAAKIPVRAKGRFIDKLFRWTSRVPAAEDGLPGKASRVNDAAMTCVSMGNPHAVFFTTDLSKTPVSAWGPEIETHPFFPRRTNVEFAEVLGPRSVRVRVWERGAGLTLACGTGACAVAVAGVLTGRLQRAVIVSLPGGDLQVEWAADDHVYLTGAAEFVFEGNF
ncbi:MAG: diaminopimelate epimerase [Elusimicrobiota bacterium]